jgi:hypothetical protein
MIRIVKIKITNTMATVATKNPKLLMLGIAFAITLVLATFSGLHIHNAYAGNHIHIPT